MTLWMTKTASDLVSLPCGRAVPTPENERSRRRLQPPRDHGQNWSPDMADHSHPRPPATQDREDRLRAAARLLDHLADGAVPDDEIPCVELAVGDLLGRAGVLP